MRNRSKHWISLFITPAIASVGVVSASASDQPAIILDGSMDDWPAGLLAAADERWIYLRYDASEPLSLQNGSVMTVLQIDLDANERTGFASHGADLGVDLEITMTVLDQRDPLVLGGGIEISAYGPDELYESLTHTNIGFSFLPTHASTSFELRLAREVDGPNWFKTIARTTDRIRYRFIHRDAQYQTKWTGDVRTLDLPGMSPGRELFSATVPGKETDTLRIVSWNVLWGTPSKHPDGYARVLRSLNPDVILFQEWDNGYWTHEDRIPERDYLNWLNKHLGPGSWSIRRCSERGVLIVSRSPLSEFLPETIEIKSVRGAGRIRNHGIRCASARVATPLGEVGAVSVHLKSRGGLDSAEDRTRLAEVEVIHDYIREAMEERAPDFLVIAGDWNLVGGRKPLERALDGLDFEGSDLLVVEARRLGIGDAITWRDQRSPFSPGRLDYALVADDGVEIVRSFVLDTTLLTDATLLLAGVNRQDTDGSDHLPMVIDLRRVSKH